MALEPITRQEKIIAGQDLTPITRMEKFLKQYGGSGGSGGGAADDVYTIKRITNGETGEMELQGDYAGALAAFESGKNIQFAECFLIDGNEFVRSKSFSFVYSPAHSNFKFISYNGKNFITHTLTESGITDSSNDTHLGSLHVDGAGSLFLKGTGGTNKEFRVSVSDTGELSTEEVT